MSFMKRAGLYCLRQRFKTVILLLVLTLIAALMLTGIAIRDASAGAAADVQTAIGGKIELNLDTEGHMGSGQQNEWGTVYSYNGDLITQDIVRVTTKTADLHVQIDAAYLIPLYLIGILLIGVSVTASSWTVVRSKPNDILTKMS